MNMKELQEQNARIKRTPNKLGMVWCPACDTIGDDHGMKIAGHGKWCKIYEEIVVHCNEYTACYKRNGLHFNDMCRRCDKASMQRRKARPLFSNNVPAEYKYNKDAPNYLREEQMAKSEFLNISRDAILMQVWEYQGGNCVACAANGLVWHELLTSTGGANIRTLEHIVPLTRGGLDEESNWTALCQMHNAAKQNKHFYAWETKPGFKFDWSKV